jgi:hypothetical protein
MKLLLIILLVCLIIYLTSCNKIEHFWSRPNKCFDCENQITSIKDAHLAFPSKCFDCEKQSAIPYNTGPTKCFDCENTKIKEEKCKAHLDDLSYYFANFGRNTQMVGRF